MLAGLRWDEHLQPKNHPRACPGMDAIVDHCLTVDYDVGDAGRILVGCFEGSQVRYGVWIEYHQIGIVPFPHQSSIRPA